MKTRDADILIVPGLGGSGPDHWQTRWQAKLSTARRVEQDNWDHPRLASWQPAIEQAILAADRPVVIVAHSLGVIAAAFASFGMADRVAGAFLVAPPSAATIASLPEIASDFRPYPSEPLPCRSIVVASRDDPFATFAEVEALAGSWGATTLDAGAAGHINTESGHGPWPEGLMAFAGFLAKL